MCALETKTFDELYGVGIACAATARQAFDLEGGNGSVFRDRTRAIERADIAPNHHADDGVDIRVSDRFRSRRNGRRAARCKIVSQILKTSSSLW